MLIESLFECLTVWIKDSGQKTAGAASAVYMSQTYVRNGKISFIQIFLRFLLLLIELSHVKKSLNCVKVFWTLLLCDL